MSDDKTAPRLTISEDDLMAALREAKAAVRPLIVTKWKDSIDIDEPSYVAICLAEAILSRTAPQCEVHTVDPEASIPTYGNIPWDQLGRDVVEAQIGTRRDFEFDPKFYPGHQSPGINFNSLARIVDKYRLSSPVPSAEGK